MKALGSVFRGIRLTVTAIVLAAVGLFVGAGAIHHYTTAPPSSVKAAYLVQTSSLIYLTNSVHQDSSGTVTMNGYYTLNGDHYVFNKGTLVLSKALYGNIEVEPRAGN
jgi:hypothetical protein